jgi:hypothetical protein
VLLLERAVIDVAAFAGGREYVAYLWRLDGTPAVLEHTAHLARQWKLSPGRFGFPAAHQHTIMREADVLPFKPMAFIRTQSGFIQDCRHICEQGRGVLDVAAKFVIFHDTFPLYLSASHRDSRCDRDDFLLHSQP